MIDCMHIKGRFLLRGDANGVRACMDGGAVMVLGRT